MFTPLLLSVCILLYSPTRGTNAQESQCVTRDEIETIVTTIQAATVSAVRDEIRQVLASQELVPGSFQNPALSCSNISDDYPSGYYWIKGTNGSACTPYRKYCDMSRKCCNNRGGWMRVVNLDMTDPNQQCPSGLRPVTSPRRLCGGRGNGCTSTTFPVHGVEYSRVCGRIKAYQYASPDAFKPYYNQRSRTIDGLYVDGVSLTHGQSPRKHIWTFAVGLIEGHIHTNICPCSRPNQPYRGLVPHFVGHDYFCESGSQGGWNRKLYSENPLWDGEGCRGSSTCCSFNSPPYFCKKLPQSTTDDIELRICGDQHTGDEDVQLEIVELYVQ